MLAGVLMDPGLGQGGAARGWALHPSVFPPELAAQPRIIRMSGLVVQDPRPHVLDRE